MRRLFPVLFLSLLLLVGVVASAQAITYIGPSSSPPAGSNVCNDGNAGTRLNPVCSFETARTLANAGDKIIYLRGQPSSGTTTYTRTTSYDPNNGEVWSTDPLDLPHSAVINVTGITAIDGFNLCSQNGFTFKNLTVVGPINNSGPDVGIFHGSYGCTVSNMHIENNHFTGNKPLNTYQSDITLHGPYNDIYIQGNTFTQSSPWGVSIAINAGVAGTYNNVYITDNRFPNGCYPFCIEWFSNSFDTVGDHYHVDRNVFENVAIACPTCGSCPGSSAPYALSYAQKRANVTNATIWGNTFSQPTNAFNHGIGIEGITGDGGNVTISQNTFTWLGRGIVFNIATGAVVENNIFTLRTSGFSCINPNCGGAACAYATETDGGDVYSATEWYGTNTYNGTDHTGCTVVGAPNFCVQAPHSQGAKPAVWSPSAPFALGPSFTFSALPASVASGGTVNLAWSAVTPSAGVTCTASVLSGQADTAWNTAGTGPTSAALIAGNLSPGITSTPRTGATTYRMSCTDGVNPAVNFDAPVTIAAAMSLIGISDTFTGGTLNASLWELNSLTETLSTGVAVVQANNRIEINAGTGVAATVRHRGIRSVAAFDLTGKTILVELVQVAAGGNVGTIFAAETNAANWIRFDKENALLYTQVMVGGSFVLNTNTTYNATNHRWLRISHVSAGDLIEFYVSADGLTWGTPLASVARGALPITAMDVGVDSGTYDASVVTQAAFFDNFNVPPGGDTTPPAAPTNLRIVNP